MTKQYYGQKRRKKKNHRRTTPHGLAVSPVKEDGSRTKRSIVVGPSLKKNGITKEGVLEKVQELYPEDNFRPCSSPIKNNAGELEVHTPNGSKLHLEDDIECFAIFSDKPQEPHNVLNFSSPGTNPAAAISPPKNAKKNFYAVITLNDKPTYKHGRNQQKVMARKEYKYSDASANNMAYAIGLKGEQHLSHLVAYAFVGEEGQVALNLVACSRASNYNMKLSDYLLNKLIVTFPDGVTIDATAHLYEGTHVAKEIHQLIDNPELKAPLEFKFDAQEQHPANRKYFHVLNGIAKKLEEILAKNQSNEKTASNSNETASSAIEYKERKLFSFFKDDNKIPNSAKKPSCKRKLFDSEETSDNATKRIRSTPQGN